MLSEQVYAGLLERSTCYISLIINLLYLVAGAIVHVGEDLLGAAAYHLVVVAATADLLHIVILVVIHLMQTGKLCLVNYLRCQGC